MAEPKCFKHSFSHNCTGSREWHDIGGSHRIYVCQLGLQVAQQEILQRVQDLTVSQRIRWDGPGE